MHPRRLRPSRSLSHCTAAMPFCCTSATVAKLRIKAIASFEAAVIYPYDV